MNSNSILQTGAPQPQDALGAPPRFPVAILFFVWLLVSLIATLVTFILPESYSSSTRIKVERDRTDIPGMAERETPPGYDPYFIQTELELIQSEVVLGKVVEDLDLNREWGKEYASGERLKTTESMAILKARLDLRPVRNTSLLEIRVFSEKPEEAARIANAIAEVYRKHRQDQRKELSTGGIKALEEKWQAQEAKVRVAQINVDRLRKELNIWDAMASGEGSSPLMTADTLRRLESLRIESQAEYIRQQSLLTSLEDLKRERGLEGLAQVIPTAAEDNLLNSLLEQLVIAEQKLVTAEKDHKLDDAEVIKCKAGAQDLHSKITNRVDGILAGLEARVTSQRKTLDVLKREVESAKTNDIITAAQSRPYFDAKRNLDELLRFRQVLDMKIASEQIDVTLPKTMMVEIVDTAKPGLRPVRPNKPLNIMLSLIIGAVGGLFLATLVYVLQRREFRRISGAPRTHFPPLFRAVVHILIALVVGVVVGYHCATPLSLDTIIVVPLTLLLGGIASAYIELANPRLTPESAPGGGRIEPKDAALRQ
jgi:uncharacterized protein involved in exopolysaccharide biosynthesis